MRRSSEDYVRNSIILGILTCIFYILNRVFSIIAGAPVWYVVFYILCALAMGFVLVINLIICVFKKRVKYARALLIAASILSNSLLRVGPIAEVFSLLNAEGLPTLTVVISIISVVCGVLLIVSFVMSLRVGGGTRGPGRVSFLLHYFALVVLCIAYTVESVFVIVELAKDASLMKTMLWSLLSYFSYVFVYLCYGGYSDQQRRIGR